ncbi:Nuclear cap-binding protein subunit 1 [Vitis vinifera]|uniref:Nuclear cap-binding protein subunit 1 n=1 Tax=Vitis vinifera TaxID=29760 RepID=A0A438F2P6_VITVI|nr:Nuclear cap-binding protein subunit 1 [Vitis vinifera]
MCSKVIQPGPLVVVFETLLSSAATTVDEEKGNPSWQACADFYITCILSCLPWGGAEFVEQVPEEIERVMVGVEAYLSIRRHISDIGLSFFEDDDETEKNPDEKLHPQHCPYWNSNLSTVAFLVLDAYALVLVLDHGFCGSNGLIDFLEDLWGRIQVLSSNGWKLDSVPRPHLSFEAQLVAGKSHDFGPLSCPELPDPPSTLSGITCGKQKHDAELKYPQRIRRLNIFPANKIEWYYAYHYLLCQCYCYCLPMPFLSAGLAL